MSLIFQKATLFCTCQSSVSLSRYFISNLSCGEVSQIIVSSEAEQTSFGRFVAPYLVTTGESRPIGKRVEAALLP